MVDMAHIAGLGSRSPSKSSSLCSYHDNDHSQDLRGPRGGLILTNDEELTKKI